MPTPNPTETDALARNPLPTGRMRLGLILRALLLVAPILGAFVQTSCWIYVDDCDDDDDDGHDHCHDDDDDDDDDGRLTGGSPQPEASPPTFGAVAIAESGFFLRLANYELIASEGPPAHPVRMLIDIRGIVLQDPGRVGSYGEADFREFTRAILRENWDLIGIPEAAGQLVFESVEIFTDEIRVRWVQRPLLVPWPILVDSSAATTFTFDGQRRLVEIDNTTRIRPF